MHKLEPSDGLGETEILIVLNFQSFQPTRNAQPTTVIGASILMAMIVEIEGISWYVGHLSRLRREIINLAPCDRLGSTGRKKAGFDTHFTRNWKTFFVGNAERVSNVMKWTMKTIKKMFSEHQWMLIGARHFRENQLWEGKFLHFDLPKHVDSWLWLDCSKMS